VDCYDPAEIRSVKGRAFRIIDNEVDLYRTLEESDSKGAAPAWGAPPARAYFLETLDKYSRISSHAWRKSEVIAILIWL
jgi:hypothetical protein